ncbi:transposase [Nesterenkonia xinjiangensis]|uniref:Transposase n=1 Tax=Nesterenkonia xinjiangensis TaxID=225327 RepID=A0A7Z0GNT1_9MICC|nr:transposase [Nesterenkonia xinjiangensis]
MGHQCRSLRSVSSIAWCWDRDNGQPVRSTPPPGRRIHRSLSRRTDFHNHPAAGSRGLPNSIIFTTGQAGVTATDPATRAGPYRRDGPGRPRMNPDEVIMDKADSHPPTRSALGAHRIRFISPERVDQHIGRKAKRASAGRPSAFSPESFRGRNVIERWFGCLRHFRGLATRYADARRTTSLKSSSQASSCGYDNLQESPYLALPDTRHVQFRRWCESLWRA